jgi:hypothetical protein
MNIIKGTRLERALSSATPTTMNIVKGTRLERALKSFSPRSSDSKPSPELNFLLSAIWAISGIAAVLIPLIYRTIHKNKYEQAYLSYYYEQEMEYYERQRYEAYQRDGNNYAYQSEYMNSQNWMQRQYIDVNDCRWWQLNCFSYFVKENGEPAAQQGWYPTWYSGWATTEEEAQERHENREQPGSLKFVYVWQVLMFMVIIGYGLLVIRENRNPTGLIVALVVWSNFAFMSMWLMADGSIATEGEDVYRSGFYGQMSVLIFMANFWYFLHGIVFALIFWIRGAMMADDEEVLDDITKKNGQETSTALVASDKQSSYLAPEQPTKEPVLT